MVGRPLLSAADDAADVGDVAPGVTVAVAADVDVVGATDVVASAADVGVGVVGVAVVGVASAADGLSYRLRHVGVARGRESI